MRRKLLSRVTTCTLIFAVIVSTMANLSNQNSAVAEAKKKVYYVPGSSYAYHRNRNCVSLRRSKNVKAISISQAKSKGLRACRIKSCR